MFVFARARTEGEKVLDAFKRRADILVEKVKEK